MKGPDNNQASSSDEYYACLGMIRFSYIKMAPKINDVLSVSNIFGLSRSKEKQEIKKPLVSLTRILTWSFLSLLIIA